MSEKTLYSHFESRREMLIAAMGAVFEKAREKTFLTWQDANVLEHLRKTHESRRLAEGGFVYPLYEFFAAPPKTGGIIFQLHDCPPEMEDFFDTMGIMV